MRGKKLKKDRKMTYPVTNREVEEFIYNAFERRLWSLEKNWI